MATNQGFQNLVPKQDVEIDFLYYLLRHHSRGLERLAAGSTFLEVSKNAVRGFQVTVPPLAEQRKIAAILSSVDDAIEKAQAVVDQVEVVKRGLMQRLFTPAHQSDTARNGWRSVRLGEVADQRTQKLRPTLNDKCPYVALEHLAQGTPTILGWHESNEASSDKTVFHMGDVLFGKLRPNLRKAALAPFDGVCSTDIIPLYCGDDLDERYLVQLVHWHPFKRCDGNLLWNKDAEDFLEATSKVHIPAPTS